MNYSIYLALVLATAGHHTPEDATSFCYIPSPIPSSDNWPSSVAILPLRCVSASIPATPAKAKWKWRAC
jgi:hypothetical protein